MICPQDRLYCSRLHDGWGPLETVEHWGHGTTRHLGSLGAERKLMVLPVLLAPSALLSSMLMVDNRAPGLSSSFPS